MAHAWFFPAAALYATLLLPLSVAGLLGVLPMPPGLAQPLGHAHELLFGYALAVVAGYLLGPQPQPRCLALRVESTDLRPVSCPLQRRPRRPQARHR